MEIYSNKQQQFLIKWLKKLEKDYKCVDPGYYYVNYGESNFTDDGLYDYIYYSSTSQNLCNEISWWIGLERVKGSTLVC